MWWNSFPLVTKPTQCWTRLAKRAREWSDCRTASVNISTRWRWARLARFRCWKTSRMASMIKSLAGRVRAIDVFQLNVLKGAIFSELNSWFLQSMLRGTSKPATVERKDISVSDIFEFDLSFPELNLSSALLSFSNILPYVWRGTSLYRSTKWLLTDIYSSFDSKRARNCNLRRKELNNWKTKKFSALNTCVKLD